MNNLPLVASPLASSLFLTIFRDSLPSLAGFVILSFATRPENPFNSTVFNGTDVGFLVLSSVIGILIGDNTWLEALRLIGARRVIVVDTLKPFMASVLGVVILNEHLKGWA